MKPRPGDLGPWSKYVTSLPRYQPRVFVDDVPGVVALGLTPGQLTIVLVASIVYPEATASSKDRIVLATYELGARTLCTRQKSLYPGCPGMLSMMFLCPAIGVSGEAAWKNTRMGWETFADIP